MEKDPNKERFFLEEAAKKWKDMDWGERQHWLAQIADENQLPKMKFTMTYKHFDFDKIPDEYKNILARKWGLLDNKK